MGKKNVKYIECRCVYLAKQNSAVVSVFCTVQSCYSEFPTEARGFIGCFLFSSLDILFTDTQVTGPELHGAKKFHPVPMQWKPVVAMY